MNNNETFKILSIDGGGILVLYSLYMLNELENKYCKSGETLSNYFDIICGTSTGGLVALGIANKIPIQKIIDEFECNAKLLFPEWQLSKFWHNFKFYFCSKYSHDSIFLISERLFGNSKMCKLNNLVCIPSFTVETYKNSVFKFPHKDGNLFMDKELKVTDVVLATTSLPYYFPIHKVKHKFREGFYIDGGIWANNPALVGITEALDFFVGKNKQYEKYDVLSIGNIEYNYGMYPKNVKKFWNIFKFNFLCKTIMYSQNDALHRFTKTICNATHGNYTRIRYVEFPKKYVSELFPDNSNKEFIYRLKHIAKNDTHKILDECCDTHRKYNINRFFTKQKTYNTNF